MDTSDVGRRQVDGKFSNAMKVAGRALGAAGSVVAPFIPGGSVVKAAVMGASAFASAASRGDLNANAPMAGTAGMTAGYADGAAGTAGTSLTGGIETTMGTAGDSSGMGMMDMLNLQLAVQRETLQYQALSNVAKARHDAAMNSVRNIKG